MHKRLTALSICMLGASLRALLTHTVMTTGTCPSWFPTMTNWTEWTMTCLGLDIKASLQIIMPIQNLGYIPILLVTTFCVMFCIFKLMNFIGLAEIKFENGCFVLLSKINIPRCNFVRQTIFVVDL